MVSEVKTAPDPCKIMGNWPLNFTLEGLPWPMGNSWGGESQGTVLVCKQAAQFA